MGVSMYTCDVSVNTIIVISLNSMLLVISSSMVPFYLLGYGHIAPGTKWGRLVCIAYAVIGIPTFMLFLAKIGEVLANLFRVTYSTVCCCGCCRKNEEKEKTAVSKDSMFDTAMIT